MAGKENRMGWRWILYIGCWSALVTLIYWLKTYIVYIYIYIYIYYKEIPEVLLVVSKEMGLEKRGDKTKHMYVTSEWMQKEKLTRIKNFFFFVNMAKYINTKTSPEKVSFIGKLRSEWIQRKPATIWYRIVCLPVTCPKPQTLKYIEIKYCLLFCMGVRLGLSHWGRNIGWRCWRIACCVRYLGLKETR
jgi:hypothetical protein